MNGDPEVRAVVTEQPLACGVCLVQLSRFSWEVGTNHCKGCGEDLRTRGTA
jgi:hypothetical protein